MFLFGVLPLVSDHSKLAYWDYILVMDDAFYMDHFYFLHYFQVTKKNILLLNKESTEHACCLVLQYKATAL